MIGTTSRILKYTPVGQDDVLTFHQRTTRNSTMSRAQTSYLNLRRPMILTPRNHKHPDFLEFLHLRNAHRNKQKENLVKAKMRMLSKNMLFDYDDYLKIIQATHNTNHNEIRKYKVKVMGSFKNMLEEKSGAKTSRFTDHYDKLLTSINKTVMHRNPHIMAQEGV